MPRGGNGFIITNTEWLHADAAYSTHGLILLIISVPLHSLPVLTDSGVPEPADMAGGHVAGTGHYRDHGIVQKVFIACRC